MLIGDDEQEVIFEIESLILRVYILNELLHTYTKIKNAKVAVFVGNSMCLICRCLGSSNVKI